MANLKQAFEYASQNPDSDFAKNLEKLASSGSLDGEAKKYGIDLTPFKPEPTLASKLGGRAKDLANAVTTFGTLGASSLTKEDIAEGRQSNEQGALVATQALANAGMAPMKALGAVGGAVGDIVGAGLQATGLDKPLGEALAPIAESDIAQGAIKAFQSLPPEYQDYLKTGMDASNLVGIGLGKKAVATGLEVGATAVKPVTATAGKLLSKANPTEAQAISNTYKGIMDIVENKKSLLKSFTKSEGSGKDPISLIAENPDYMVKINKEAKTIDAGDSIANMKRDIADFSSVRDSLLATADETLPAISTNKIIKDTLTKFSAKNYSTYLDEGEKAVKDIVTKLQTLKKYNPETVSRVELNNIRKALDETINSFTDTKLKDRMRADLRSVFKNNLEQSIPESGLLADLNSKIGDLLDASNFLEKSLNGTKVKGGGLTDLAMKATGASIGATGLGGAIGGVPGAIGGYFISDFLSKKLIQNAINNPFDRAVLDKLKSVRPDVVKRAEDYISGSSSQSPVSSTELLEKSQVPSPNPTPTTPKSKGIRGMINLDYLPTLKKQVKSAEKSLSEGEKMIMTEQVASTLNDAGIDVGVVTKKNYNDILERAKFEISDTLLDKQKKDMSTPFVKKSQERLGDTKKTVVSSLEQEAKKYKSAEEFMTNTTELTYKNLEENPYSIKAYGKNFNEPVNYFRAGAIRKNGDIWLTDNEAGAIQYSSAGGGTKIGSYIVQSKNPLIIDTAGGKYAQGNLDIKKILSPEELSKGYTNNPDIKAKFIKYAKDNGYDAVQFSDSFPDGEGGMRSLVVWDKNQVKTKKQLVDIWKLNNR